MVLLPVPSSRSELGNKVSYLLPSPRRHEKDIELRDLVSHLKVLLSTLLNERLVFLFVISITLYFTIHFPCSVFFLLFISAFSITF